MQRRGDFWDSEGLTSSLVSISGTSISGLSLNINIVQAPHHWAHPIENVIESLKIPVFISSICCWFIRKQCPELLEAQGAMRASRPYREVIVSARAR